MEQHFEQDANLNTFQDPALVDVAKQILSKADQSEAEFLGAQAVLLMNGLI